MCVALFAGLTGRGTRRKETGDVVWTLQFGPQRGDLCVRVSIIGHILLDALRLMGNVYDDMSGWSPKHFREIFQPVCQLESGGQDAFWFRRARIDGRPVAEGR